MEAHGPYLSQPPFYDLFADASAPGFSELRDKVDLIGLDSLTAPQQDYLFPRYDGAIADVDDQRRRLVERLRSLGIYDDSLIIITSDHGEAFDEKGIVGHSISLYQHQVHVPLIIKFPQQRQGEIVDSFVSHVDLMPTVLDVLGIDPVGELQGRSLIEESRDPQEARKLDVGSDPRAVAALATLSAWLRETPQETGPSEKVDPATQRHLEAHGYLR